MGAVHIVLRAPGLPVGIFIGMLAFYEGVPVLRDIPYADRIPVVRELIVGRVGTERAPKRPRSRRNWPTRGETVSWHPNSMTKHKSAPRRRSQQEGGK